MNRLSQCSNSEVSVGLVPLEFCIHVLLFAFLCVSNVSAFTVSRGSNGEFLVDIPEKVSRVALLKYSGTRDYLIQCSTQHQVPVDFFRSWIDDAGGQSLTPFEMLMVRDEGGGFQFFPIAQTVAISSREVDHKSGETIMGSSLIGWFVFRADQVAEIREIDFGALGLIRPLLIRPRKEGEGIKVDGMNPTLFQSLNTDLLISLETVVRANVSSRGLSMPSPTSLQRIAVWAYSNTRQMPEMLCSGERELAVEVHNLVLLSANQWALSE